MPSPLRRATPPTTASPRTSSSPRLAPDAGEGFVLVCLRDLPEGLLAAATAALDAFSRRSGIGAEVGSVPLAAARRGAGPGRAGTRAARVAWRAVAELRFGHCPGLLVAERRAGGRVALRIVPFACAADALRVAEQPEPGHLLPARPPRVRARPAP